MRATEDLQQHWDGGRYEGRIVDEKVTSVLAIKRFNALRFATRAQRTHESKREVDRFVDAARHRATRLVQANGTVRPEPTLRQHMHVPRASASAGVGSFPQED